MKMSIKISVSNCHWKIHLDTGSKYWFSLLKNIKLFNTGTVLKIRIRIVLNLTICIEKTAQILNPPLKFNVK